MDGSLEVDSNHRVADSHRGINNHRAGASQTDRRISPHRAVVAASAAAVAASAVAASAAETVDSEAV